MARVSKAMAGGGFGARGSKAMARGGFAMAGGGFASNHPIKEATFPLQIIPPSGIKGSHGCLMTE